ncbi:RHS repeat domain-containing protein [Abyssalbus ytuae]|uniref:RHS repeat-associated core domain-containing protein n=1 Tax=Abyssalbus ytuae TaxID=2926907 RepID=A0A9E6ZIR6_9FLAO|nr:RHS repeat-associated core domain-containing protein [Abyssalbus ytuae]UOB16292.1 hypothetical protein MQE35_11140 [Abyssalbus ytuae]
MTDGSSVIYIGYTGNYIYENGSLKMFFHPEGYFDVTDTPPSGELEGVYVYQYKDHLGNIRLSYSDSDGNGIISAQTEIVEENNYYPFGLTHQGYNNSVSSLGNAVAKKYMFGGKEYQDKNIGGNQLNWYDVSARNYDPALGRWMNLDPLAEQMRRYSPYNYAFDNPIYFIDPDGMLSKSFLDELWKKSDNETTWTNNNDGTFSGSNGKTASTGENGNENGEPPSNPAEFFNYFLSLFGLSDYNLIDKIKAEQNGEHYMSTVSLNPQGEVKEWVINNREQLLNIAQISQDVGDATAVVGYVLTISVVGAEVGVPLNGISTAGSALEITVNLATSDLQSAANEAGWVVAGELVDMALRKVPDGSALGSQILKQNGAVKVILTERVIEAKQ